MRSVKIFVAILLCMSFLFQVRFVHAFAVPLALITPSATAIPTITPFEISSATQTFIPTHTPIVVTVIHTIVVTVISTNNTPSGRVTSTITPTVTSTTTLNNADEKETGNQSALSIAIIGMVATFIAGIVVGTLWSGFRKR